MPQTATITRLPEAFEMIKEMAAQDEADRRNGASRRLT